MFIKSAESVKALKPQSVNHECLYEQSIISHVSQTPTDTTSADSWEELIFLFLSDCLSFSADSRVFLPLFCSCFSLLLYRNSSFIQHAVSVSLCVTHTHTSSLCSRSTNPPSFYQQIFLHGAWLG